MARAVLFANSVIAEQAARLVVAEPKAIAFDSCFGTGKLVSLTKHVRALDGMNSLKIKRDLANLGYLRRYKAHGYRVYHQYRMKQFGSILCLYDSDSIEVLQRISWFETQLAGDITS